MHPPVFKARRASRCATCGLPGRQHLPLRTRVHRELSWGLSPATERACYCPPPIEAGDIPLCYIILFPPFLFIRQCQQNTASNRGRSLPAPPPCCEDHFRVSKTKSWITCVFSCKEQLQARRFLPRALRLIRRAVHHLRCDSAAAESACC